LYIDLERAPMLRTKIADDTGKGTYYLVLNYHHLMMDHVGLEKVVQEIMVYLSKEQEILPPPAMYRDFIGHALEKLRSGEGENYFKSVFAEVRESSYPFALTDTKGDGSTKIFTSKAVLPTELRDAVRKVSAELRISPATLFHAAFGIVVARCSGTEYALFGSLLLGRLQGARGSEASLGLFINTLPILLEQKGSTREYIQCTNERLQGLLEHEQTPLSKVHQWSGIPNDAPIFTALLNYRHSVQGRGKEDIPELGMEVIAGEERTNYPFNLFVDDYGKDFGLTAKLSDMGINPYKLVAYVQQALRGLLQSIQKGGDNGVSGIPILPEEERLQLLEGFNDTDVDFPKDATIVDLFQQRADSAAEAIAVVYEGERLTYSQLDQRTNQLARYLGEQGAGPNALVGICIERGIEMIVGILGILKAGAAYLPMDPQYPKARIAHMVADSGTKILLTSSTCAKQLPKQEHTEKLILDTQWKDKVQKRSTKRMERAAGPE
ncbi:MAG: AMP-binding protein, partial [Verrucomicrobiota bacterium]